LLRAPLRCGAEYRTTPTPPAAVVRESEDLPAETNSEVSRCPDQAGPLA
jgi:hypothetical protein